MPFFKRNFQWDSKKSLLSIKRALLGKKREHLIFIHIACYYLNARSHGDRAEREKFGFEKTYYEVKRGKDLALKVPFLRSLKGLF